MKFIKKLKSTVVNLEEFTFMRSLSKKSMCVPSKMRWPSLSIFCMICLCIFSGCDRQASVKIKKAKVGDIELAYYTRGSGDPLVMIMGFRGTMAIWDPALLEELEKKHTLILFDNRGVGLSSDTVEDFTTISQMAEDTVHLIQSLGFEKADILGWSMGSRIALQLAIQFPEMVDHLILCSPSPGGGHQAPRTSNAYKELTAADVSMETGLSVIFPSTVQGKLASAAFVTRLTKAIALGTVPDDIQQVSSQTVARQVRALKRWNEDNSRFEELAKIHVPTLVTGGLEDVLDNPENVRIVANQIPFAWAAYFAGAGHYFLSQEHQSFADLVTLFIDSTKKDSN